MKKIAVIGIAVLFSLIGFKHASAQSTMGGHLTTLSLHVTYRADVPATKTLSEGKKLVTVASGLNKVVAKVHEYDPVIYLDFDADGNITKIVFDWLSPNPAVVALPDVVGGRIYTISCSGGNQLSGTPPPYPDLPELLDGTISTKPELSIAKPPATEKGSFQGVATCYFCPEGFQFSSPGVTTGYCNDGTSYGKGYLIFKGTFVAPPDGSPTSISMTGQVGGAGFIYVGDDWASADYTGSGTPKALFYGTFGATLTLCSDSTCSTL